MIKIVADTLSCIPTQEARDLGILYFPQMIIFGDEIYRDDTEIDSSTFLQKLKSSTILPKTAAPSPALYLPVFEDAERKGDTLIAICPPQTLSGTYRSVEVAAKDFPKLDLHLIDTLNIGGNLGSIVLRSIEWVKQGLDAVEIVNKIKNMSSRQRTYFVVDTLEYLHRGGRIGGAKALFGSILQVKPILQLINGQVEPFESQRTHKRALARLREIINSECPNKPEAHLSIMHSDAEELAQNLAEEFSKNLGIENIPIYIIPPAILVHAGPGALAVGYFTEEDSL